jgi:hypothetical protein
MRTALLTMTVCLLVLPANAQYSGGTGEPNDPYQIATAADLIALGEDPNDYDRHFILIADIDLDPNLPGRRVFDRAVIAPDVNDTDYYLYYEGRSFTGLFDGNRHVIRNLHIQGRDYLGLFGQAGLEAKISNVGLDAVDVNGTGDWVGGLVAWNRGSVTGSCSTGSVSGGDAVGGLVGANYGTVIDSYSACMTTGGSAGGLVGVNGPSDRWRGPAPVGDDSGSGLVGNGPLAAQIRTSYSSGLVTGSEHVGGLVGRNSGSIADSYSRSPVSLDCEYAGGLVGWNAGSISSSYSRGVVSGGLFSGGLVSLGVGNITSSFWDIQTCGWGWLSGWEQLGGNAGLTTAEMQTASTFLAAGWDFVGETANGTEDLWWINEGKDYPRLWWELPGDEAPAPSDNR